MNTNNPACTHDQPRLAQATQDTVLEVLTGAIPGLIAVYVFGTAGTQYQRPSSDVDLAFLSVRRQTPVAVWNTAQTLAARIGRDVDLIDLRNASTVMAARIITSGTRLLCTQANRCAEFEAHTLSDYARLNEERAGILKDIQERGSIHAR